MTKLSRRQQDILDFIKDEVSKRGYPLLSVKSGKLLDLLPAPLYTGTCQDLKKRIYPTRPY